MDAGNWQLETGSWKLATGSWELGAGNDRVVAAHGSEGTLVYAGSGFRL